MYGKTLRDDDPISDVSIGKMTSVFLDDSEYGT